MGSAGWVTGLVLVALSSLGGCRVGFEPGSDPQEPDPSLRRFWTILQPHQNPGPLWGPKMVYLESRGTLILYGGHRGDTTSSEDISAEMWEFDGIGWRRLCADCAPGPRARHGLIYDPDRDRVMLIGGVGPEGLAGESIWEWTPGGDWREQSATGDGPGPHRDALVAYDRMGGRALFYGGVGLDDEARASLYSLDGTRWERLLPSGPNPGPRSDSSCAATFDDYSRRFLIYAGLERSVRDDMWAFDGQAWTQLCTQCTGRPRFAATLVHDPASGRVVMTGGYTGGDEIAGTWEFDGQAWAVSDPDQPAKRDTCGVAYDTNRDRIVLFGGNGGSCDGPGGHCEETYEFIPIR